MASIDLPRCVISAINFKGGTGKTTVAIAIAEGLCHFLGKRVVVIDCDFQCSASIALLGRRALNDLILRQATLDSRLQQRIGNGNGNGACADAITVKTHFCVSEASELMYLMPASPDMPRRERQILAAFLTKADIHSAHEQAAVHMAAYFRSLLEDFDVVLIDCPPGLTLFSEAAIRAADGFVIPTLPNEISFAAIDHLRAEIGRARPDRTFEDLLVGTVVSKLRQKNGNDHYRYQNQSIERLLDRAAPGFQILRPYLPYCRELEAASWRDGEPGRLCFAERYGQASAMIEQLVGEFVVKGSALMRRVRVSTASKKSPALAGA